MKLSSTALRAAAATVVGGLVLGAAGNAFAATPAFEPDTTNQLGQIVFYNSAGQVITGGNAADKPMAAYSVATTNDPVTTDTKATLYGYAANSAAAIGAWSGQQQGAAQTFPVATTAPTNIQQAGTNRPVVTGTTADFSVADLQAAFPNPTDAKYANIYQMRIKTFGNTKWWAADIQYTPATATAPASWTQLYPNVNQTPAVSLSANPAGNAVNPASVTLSSTVSDGAIGSVTFSDSFTPRGATAATVTTLGTVALPASPAAGANTATFTQNAPAQGSHVYTATYNPAAGSTFATGTSPTATTNVVPPSDSTSTTVSVSPTPQYTGTTFTLSSTVTDTQATPAYANPVGTVTWTDAFTPTGGTTATTTTLGSAPTAAVSGSTTQSSASYTVTGGVSGVGSHVITATFAATDSTKWSGSNASAPAFTTTAQPCPVNTCDQQAFQVTVDPGTLTISTPYTAASPFNMGHMALDPKGTILRATAAFGTGTDGKGVTITDTRAGQLGWNASVTTTDFTGATKASNVINGQNLSFTGVAPQYVTGNALQAGSVTPSDVTTSADSATNAGGYAATATGSDGLKAGPHKFASAATGNSVGTVYVTGSMKIVAPTSTSADTYNGTVTFTIA